MPIKRTGKQEIKCKVCTWT